MNEELQNLGYALAVIGFIVLLVFACSGELRERAIEGAFTSCEERYSDEDAHRDMPYYSALVGTRADNRHPADQDAVLRDRTRPRPRPKALRFDAVEQQNVVSRGGVFG
jgi:hypothetical protein